MCVCSYDYKIKNKNKKIKAPDTRGPQLEQIARGMDPEGDEWRPRASVSDELEQVIKKS